MQLTSLDRKCTGKQNVIFPLNCSRCGSAFSLDVVMSSTFGIELDAQNDHSNPVYTNIKSVLDDFNLMNLGVFLMCRYYLGPSRRGMYMFQVLGFLGFQHIFSTHTVKNATLYLSLL